MLFPKRDKVYVLKPDVTQKVVWVARPSRWVRFWAWASRSTKRFC